MIPLRQVSEGLAALESERDRTDRKFEALAQAGGLAVGCFHASRTGLAFGEREFGAFLLQ